MKIHANGFYVDMNALLNQINGQNGLQNANAIIKQAWKDTEAKYNKAHNEVQTVQAQYLKDLNDTSNKNVNYINTQINETKHGFNAKNKALDEKLQRQISSAHSDIKEWVGGQKFLTPSQINDRYNKLWGHITFRGQAVNNPKQMIDAVWAEDKAVSQQVMNEHNAAQKFVTDQINSTMKGPVKSQFDDLRLTMPHNFMSYVAPGQPMPATATPGDICWVSSDFNNFSNNAKAYMYTNNNGWQVMKTQMNLYASNIYSPNINGGAITGAEFLSQYKGRDGQSVFSVDQKGDIYARNLTMDLNTHTTGEAVNQMVYNGSTDEAKGLSFDNGIMSMKAQAYQNSGTPVRSYNGAIGGSNDSDYVGMFNAYTYLEPDYLKLRGTTNAGNSLLGRTDLRGGNLELSDQWSQHWGARLGYWNNNKRDMGPLLAIENAIKLGYVGSKAEFDIDDWQFQEDRHGKLHIRPNDSNVRELDLDGPVKIGGGYLYVDGKDLAHGKDYSKDISDVKGDIDDKQATLDRHNKWLKNHAQVLATGGNIDTQGYDNWLDYKPTRLDTHDTKIGTHDEILKNQYGQVDKYNNAVTDLKAALGSVLVIKPGGGGNVDLQDPSKAGHFTFNKDISVLNGASLVVGGEYGNNGFKAQSDGGVSCNYLDIGGNVYGQLPLEKNSVGGLSVNGLFMATRRWVEQNFARKKGSHGDMTEM